MKNKIIPNLHRSNRRISEGEKNSLFVHIPKTAGRYIRRLIKKGEENSEYTLHTPARFIKKELKDYDNRLSYAVVRNPYSRFYSACKFNGVKDPKDIEEMSELMVNADVDWASKYSILHYEHFFSQKHFVTDFDNETVIVKEIGKYENLLEFIHHLRDTYFNKLADKFELKENTSSDWDKKLTTKTKENIAKLYKEDFELFRYSI